RRGPSCHTLGLRKYASRSFRDRLAPFASCRLASRAGSQPRPRLGSPPDTSRPPTRSPCAAPAQAARRPARLLWPAPTRARAIAVGTGLDLTHRRGVQTGVDAAALASDGEAWRGAAQGLKVDSSGGLGTFQPGDLSCQVAFAGRYAPCNDGLHDAAVPAAVRG